MSKFLNILDKWASGNWDPEVWRFVTGIVVFTALCELLLAY